MDVDQTEAADIPYTGEKRLATQRAVVPIRAAHKIVRCSGYCSRTNFWPRFFCLFAVLLAGPSCMFWSWYCEAPVVTLGYQGLTFYPVIKGGTFSMWLLRTLGCLFGGVLASLATWAFLRMTPAGRCRNLSVRVAPGILVLSTTMDLLGWSGFSQGIAGLEVALMLYLLRQNNANRKTVLWSPHMVSCIFQELSRSHQNRETLRHSATLVARRLASVPVDDIISDAVFEGSINLACYLLSTDETGFTTGQEAVGIFAPTPPGLVG